MPATQQPFSVAVKEELAHVWPGKPCCRLAELAGLVATCGSLELLGQGRVGVWFRTDHGSVARKVWQLVRQAWGVKVQVTVRRRRRLRKGLTYEVRVPPQPEVLAALHRAGALGGDHGLGSDLPEGVRDRKCCARSYLRGAFLGSGWLQSPVRGHHLELITQVAERADGLSQLCLQFDVPARVTARKDSMVVYVKDSDKIARFLVVVGAQEQMLQYEGVRVLKEMKNQVNRQVNAETANLSKTVEASARQTAAILELQETGRFWRLAPSLREVADLRLKHPEASLKELGELCQPQLGKSGANHRMRMLLQMAEGVETGTASDHGGGGSGAG